MYNHTIQTLLEHAEGGEKLPTNERRRVISYLKSTRPNITQIEMAGKFGVSDTTIRKDLQAIREAMAKEIKEDDVSLVIADILWDFKRQIADIERSKMKAPLGSNAYLKHCTEAMTMRLKTVEALQALGYLPKNLGNQTVTEFKYAAVVHADGSVETRAMDLFDDETQMTITQRGKVIDAAPPDRQLPQKHTVTYYEDSPGELPQGDSGVESGPQS